MDDNKDLFSYDNSGNLEETGETSFDLNSFASRTEEPKQASPKKGKRKNKGSRKERVLRAVLTLFKKWETAGKTQKKSFSSSLSINSSPSATFAQLSFVPPKINTLST